VVSYAAERRSVKETPRLRKCPSRPTYATLSATALGSSDGLALAPVVVMWAFGARMAAVLVPGAAARRSGLKEDPRSARPRGPTEP